MLKLKLKVEILVKGVSAFDFRMECNFNTYYKKHYLGIKKLNIDKYLFQLLLLILFDY